MGKLLLQFGDVKETTVRCMKKSDAQGEPEAHEKVLNIIGDNNWDGPSNRVHNLAQNPVCVQKGDGSERQRQTSESEARAVAIEPTEYHPRKD